MSKGERAAWGGRVPAGELERARAGARRLAAREARRQPHGVDTEVFVVEAELAVWRAAQGFPGGRDFLPWALQAARRALLDEQRRQGPYSRSQWGSRRRFVAAGARLPGWLRPPLSLEEPGGGGVLRTGAGTPALPTTELADALERSWVQGLLGCLEPRQRGILHRQYWLGESIPQIAAELGLSPSRVRQLRRAALERLRAAAGAP